MGIAALRTIGGQMRTPAGVSLNGQPRVIGWN